MFVKTKFLAKVEFNLFNKYFGTNYESSNALFTDRGVVSNEWIALEGAWISSAYKVAGLAHNLNFIGNDGKFLSQYFAANTDTNTAGLTDLLVQVALSYTGVFSMNLDCFWNGGFTTPESEKGAYVGTTYADGADFGFGFESATQMVALDVTDLVIAQLTAANKDTSNIFSAFMFGWEDMPLSNSNTDWDYQDLAYVMVNVRHDSSTSTTPEPATALILLAGLGVAFPLSRKLLGKKHG